MTFIDHAKTGSVFFDRLGRLAVLELEHIATNELIVDLVVPGMVNGMLYGLSEADLASGLG